GSVPQSEAMGEGTRLRALPDLSPRAKRWGKGPACGHYRICPPERSDGGRDPLAGTTGSVPQSEAMGEGTRLRALPDLSPRAKRWGKGPACGHYRICPPERSDGGRDPLAGRGSPNPREAYVWSTDPLPGSAGTPPAELGEKSLCSTDPLPGFAETSGRLLRIGTRKSRIELGQLLPNPIDGPVRVLPDFFVPEAQHCETTAPDEGVTREVVIGLQMVCAIDFDDQLRSQAREVCQVGADRVLTTKSHAESVSPEQCPQQSLLPRHGAPKLTGSLDARGGRAEVSFFHRAIFLQTDPLRNPLVRTMGTLGVWLRTCTAWPKRASASGRIRSRGRCWSPANWPGASKRTRSAASPRTRPSSPTPSSGPTTTTTRSSPFAVVASAPRRSCRRSWRRTSGVRATCCDRSGKPPMGATGSCPWRSLPYSQETPMPPSKRPGTGSPRSTAPISWSRCPPLLRACPPSGPSRPRASRST